MDPNLPIINFRAPFNVNLTFGSMLDHNNSVIPIWSNKKHLLRNNEDYVYFEIRSKEDCDSDNGVKDNPTYAKSESNIQKSICHLCNIKVPSGYMRLHQDSDKHQTRAKISEIALERVRKQMGATYVLEKNIPSMYFCQNCDVLIPVKEKQSHLISNEHKYSIIIEKLMKDLLKLYSDEEIDEDKNVIITPSEPIQENKTQNDYKAEEIIANCDKTVANPKDSRIQPTKLFLEEDLKKVIENLNNNMSKYKLQYLNKQSLIITTEDIKFKVTHENFHSFFVLGMKHIQCKLCCQIARNVNEHIFEKEHMKNLSLAIDKNCIRKIEDSESHCIICNKLIENPEIHALCDKKHDNLMMEAMIFDKDSEVIEIVQTKNDKKTKEIEEKALIKKEDVASKYYLCNVCYILVSQSDTEIHCNDPKHLSNAKIDTHYLLDYSYELRKLQCKVCDVNFPVNVMKDHLKDSNHLSSYDTFMSVNSLKKLTTNVYCELCFMYMDIGNEIKHVESPEHVTVLQSKNKLKDASKKAKKIAKKDKAAENKVEIQKIDEKQTKIVSKDTNVANNVEKKQKKSTVTCKVCDITMPDKQEDIKNHLLNYHQITDAETVIKNTKMKLVGKVFICESCCEYVAIEDELKHISGPTHIVKYLKKPDTTDTKTDTINKKVKIDDKNNNELPSTSKNIVCIPNKEKTQSKRELYCDVCDTALPKGIKSLQIHEDGKRHNLKFQEILKEHKIEEKTNHLQCTSCCVNFEKAHLISHVNSGYHLGDKKETKKCVTTISYCEPCQKYITTNMETHVLSALHKSKEITKNIPSYLCHTCDVLLTNSKMNIKEHNDGGQHQSNVKLLNDNTIKIIDDSCYCETCDMMFTFKLIKTHINTSQHLILMGNDVPQ